jgi:hypothetical protein
MSKTRSRARHLTGNAPFNSASDDTVKVVARPASAVTSEHPHKVTLKINWKWKVNRNGVNDAVADRNNGHSGAINSGNQTGKPGVFHGHPSRSEI